MVSSIGPCDFCKRLPSRTRSLRLHRRPIDGQDTMICGACRKKITDTAAAARILARRLGLPWRPTVGRVEELRGSSVGPGLLDAKDELARLLMQLSAFENGEPDSDAERPARAPAKKPENPCGRCEESEAEIRLVVTVLVTDTVLDNEKVCRACARDAGFQVGK